MKAPRAARLWRRIDVRVAASAGLIAAILLVGGVLWFRSQVYRQQMAATQQSAVTEAADIVIAAAHWNDQPAAFPYLPYQLYRSDGTLLTGWSEADVRAQGWTVAMPDVASVPDALGTSSQGPANPWGVSVDTTAKRDQLLVHGEAEGYDAFVYVTPLQADATVAGMSRYLWWGAALAWLLITATAAVTVRLALRPVERMRREAARISSTADGARLSPMRRNDELGALAATLDTMLGRLGDSFRAQQRFTADAAHELRGPLTSLRAAVEVALAHPDDVGTDETLRHVLAETDRLQDLTEQLLAVARARSVPATPDAHADPATAVERLLAGYPARAAGQVRVTDHRAAPRSASIAPVDLHRALRNLLDNALRHAATGVRVDIADADDGEGVVVLTVTNDGAPIPDGERERIFEPFVRLDDARSRDVGGTGLGLTIVRGLVERAGGSITARSRDGFTSFVVRLPTPAPDEALLATS